MARIPLSEEIKPNICIISCREPTHENGGYIMNMETLENEMLRLSPEERAHLARSLLVSLESLTEDEVSRSWLAEADRRARELDRGDVRPVSAETVREKARGLLR